MFIAIMIVMACYGCCFLVHVVARVSIMHVTATMKSQLHDSIIIYDYCNAMTEGLLVSLLRAPVPISMLTDHTGKHCFGLTQLHENSWTTFGLLQSRSH